MATSSLQEDESREALTACIANIDSDALDYFASMILDAGSVDEEGLKETLAPFVESYGLASDEGEAFAICAELCKKLREIGLKDQASRGDGNADAADAMQATLLDKCVKLADATRVQISESEQEAIDKLWGFDSIRSKRNETIELNDAGSAKYERKALKDQKKWLAELESKFIGDEDEHGTQISTMTLPDLSGTSRERDIHVSNFNITYGGQILLENADLRLVSGRRYGLIGRNGVGKTTLLKHMATFDIEGFPKHHRVLHVKQEVQSSEKSVLEVVLEADVERRNLLDKEKELQEQQRTMVGEDPAVMQQIMNELAEVYNRMQQIGVDTAESRAASILSGLRFTDEMQRASTDSLSGGWRMRVALAGALFIEPDLLMLDEPTNHLDLEAVLWLEGYLQSYPHTVLLVSHDRAFLNEVCTDVILFQNLKLVYYRGNYDAFESTRKVSFPSSASMQRLKFVYTCMHTHKKIHTQTHTHTPHTNTHTRTRTRHFDL